MQIETKEESQRSNSFLFIALCSFASFGSTSIQTDWSGGDSVSGPVPNWLNFYFTSTDIGYPVGALRLKSFLLEDPIDHFVGITSKFTSIVCADDFDDDGDIDILASDCGPGGLGTEVSWWENSDTSPGIAWTKFIIDSNDYGTVSLCTSDIDGDGDPDVFGGDNETWKLAWWENVDGSGSVWTRRQIGDAALWVICSADVDSDDDFDLLTAQNYTSGGNISWWENENSLGTSWIRHSIPQGIGGAYSICTADVDCDGDIDVITAGSGVHWFENMDGNGTVWTVNTVDSAIANSRSISASDIDCDGDFDIMAIGGANRTIVWWENIDGSGTSWIKREVDDGFYMANSAVPADIDRDGLLDVVGLIGDSDGIRWWRVSGGFLNSGVLESSILDAGDVDTWGMFSSNRMMPEGTSVGLQFRSSSDFADMGAWSDTVFSTDTPLSGILADSTRYLQYRVFLESTDSLITPQLNEVAFSYTLHPGAGTSSSGEADSFLLLPSENPSYTCAVFQLTVPESVLGDVLLYDVCGRIVANFSQEFSIGTHSINFNGLSGGVYFCVLRAGDVSVSTETVVLN